MHMTYLNTIFPRFEQDIYSRSRYKNEPVILTIKTLKLSFREENQQNARQGGDRVFSEHSTVEISGLDNATGASVFYPSKVRWKSALCVTLGDRGYRTSVCVLHVRSYE